MKIFKLDKRAHCRCQDIQPSEGESATIEVHGGFIDPITFDIFQSRNKVVRISLV